MGGSGDQDGAREESPESGQTAQGPGGTAQGDAPSSGVDGGRHPGESHQQEFHQQSDEIPGVVVADFDGEEAPDPGHDRQPEAGPCNPGEADGRDAWDVGSEGAEQGQEADHDNLASDPAGHAQEVEEYADAVGVGHGDSLPAV